MSTATEPTLAPPPIGTVQIWSDLLCPFAHVLLHTLREARRDPRHAGVEIEHRVFALELFNGPHPRRGTDTEAVGLGQIAPAAGFRVWTGPDDQYPHTVLLAAEAVRAATAQSRRGGERLDAGLRAAFWTHSRSIAHRDVVLAVAAEVAAEQPDSGLDVAELTAALDAGTFRSAVRDDTALARTDQLAGSPTVVLPDGSVSYNPGVVVRWEGPWAAGFPVVEQFDREAQVDLLRAATVAPATARR